MHKLLPFLFFFLCGASTRFRALASPISALQPSLFLPDAIQYRIYSKSTASHQKTSSHLPLGLPTDLLTPQHPPNTFSGYENHPSLLCGQSTGVCVLEISITLWGLYLQLSVQWVINLVSRFMLRRLVRWVPRFKRALPSPSSAYKEVEPEDRISGFLLTPIN